MKEILSDYYNYNPMNLLDWYILTGGIAKYIELLVLNEAYNLEKILDVVCHPNSIFLDEGKNRLIEEFGKDYMVYFSLLSLIARSKTSRSEIESILEKNVSGYLFRLENDYNIIKAIKPISGKKVLKYKSTRLETIFYFSGLDLYINIKPLWMQKTSKHLDTS